MSPGVMVGRPFSIDPRPFAAPTTTGTYTVPGTIVHDGTADASSDLQDWIDGTVPDGSIVDFAIAGANYRLDAGIYLTGREHLVFEGHGTTTLTLNGAGNSYFASAFCFQDTAHVAIHAFHVDGNNADWPTVGGENQAILTLLGWYEATPCSYIEMSAMTGGRTYGDFVYLEGKNGADYPPCSYVWVHHNTLDYCGRNAVSWINSDHTWVEWNTFNHVGYHVFDIEPNFAAESNTDAIVRHNVVGSYCNRSDLIAFFVAASAPGGASLVDGVAFTDNTVAGIAVNGHDGEPRGLNCAFWGATGNHYLDVVFTGNTTTQAVDGPAVLYFNYVDGLTVTGNTQPLLSSTLVLATNCTSAVTSPNP